MSEKNVQIKYRTDAGIYDDIYPKTKSDIIETSDGEPIEDKINRLSDYTDTKVDKEKGKQLSSHDFTKSERDKLSGIEDGANKYVHPDTHPASMIEQSTSRQFVRDTDKNKWDNKQDKLGYIPEDKSDKGKVNGYAELDSNARVPIRQLPDLSNTKTYVVKNTSEREHLSNVSEGDKSYELDTKSTYIWTGEEWELTDVGEGSVSIDWNNIKGGPSKSPEDIDQSVRDSHTHKNRNILDKLDDNGSNDLTYRGREVTAGVRKYLNKHKKNTNNPHNVTRKQIGAVSKKDVQGQVDKALKDAKNYTDKSLEEYPTTWEEINNKPTEFKPEKHTHSIGDVTDLKSELDSKETPVESQNKADKAERRANKYTDQEVGKINIPVDSVNGYTGKVTLNAKDVNLENLDNKRQATKKEFDSHKSDTDNPHSVTPKQIGAEESVNKGEAGGYASLNSKAKIPLSELPDDAKGQTYVVDNEKERNGLSDLIEGDRAYEVETGNSYIWDGKEWLVLAQANWENVNLEWTNINGKPSSNVDKIDDAVDRRHSHSNKDVLDDLKDDGTGGLLYKDSVVGEVTQSEFKNHKNNTKNPHEVTTSQIGAETPKGSQDKADKSLKNAKEYTDTEIGNIPDPVWADVKNKPTKFKPENHTHDIMDVDGLKNELDSKEIPKNAQSKADKALKDSKSYTDTEVGKINVPVDSVNGQTGKVKLTADDVNAETPKGSQDKADKAEKSVRNFVNNHGIADSGEDFSDFNEVTKPGFYKNNSNTVTNSPDGNGWYVLIVSSRNENAVSQIAVKRSSSDIPTVFVRSSYSGTWSNWAQLEDTTSVKSKIDDAIKEANNYADSRVEKIDFPEAPVLSVNGQTGNITFDASSLGLGNVTNDKQATKTEFDNHKNDKNNPHNVTPSQIGAEIPKDAQSKADKALKDAKSYTDTEVGKIPDLTWSNIKSKPSEFKPKSHKHDIKDVTGLRKELDSKETPTGAQDKVDTSLVKAKSYTDDEVGKINTFSGEYNDLSGKPDIPSKASDVGAETPSGAQSKANEAEKSANDYTDKSHQYGGKFEFQYNEANKSLDLVVIGGA